MALPPDFLSRGGAGGGGTEDVMSQRLACRPCPSVVCARFHYGVLWAVCHLGHAAERSEAAADPSKMSPYEGLVQSQKKKSIKVQTSAPKSNQSNSCGSEIKNAQKTLER